jgi:hypothetical protein
MRMIVICTDMGKLKQVPSRVGQEEGHRLAPSRRRPHH